MALLFVYGTLMAPLTCRGLLARNPQWEPAELDGHELRAVRHASYPAIVAKVGSTVRGLVLQELSEAELTALDEYEGSDYERIPVMIRVGERKVNAWVYIWTAGEESLEPASRTSENFRVSGNAQIRRT